MCCRMYSRRKLKCAGARKQKMNCFYSSVEVSLVLQKNFIFPLDLYKEISIKIPLGNASLFLQGHLIVLKQWYQVLSASDQNKIVYLFL